MLSLIFVAYFETLLQLSCICASLCVHSGEFGEKITFYHFSKKIMPIQHFSPILKRSYLLKMRGYPQFSFWILIAADMIYLSHIVIIWEKILPISGHRP